MNNAIVICSRIDSRRIPEKCFYKIDGKPVIEHLLGRIALAKIPIFIAVPEDQYSRYEYLNREFENVHVTTGSHDDPMQRMCDVANHFKIKNIVRICHDKIFVEPSMILDALEDFEKRGLDYMYSSQFTPGIVTGKLCF